MIQCENVRYLDLAVQDDALRQELLDAVEGVLRHGRIVMGPEVAELETALARQCGNAFAVAVDSGSSALYLALRCLDLGPGDEVITTPLSWVATFNAIAATRALPVAVDIGDDLNMDPAAIEAAITPNTRAIVAVHYAGLVCDMAPIMDTAARHGLDVVEDAAQAFSAHRDGSPAGSFSRLAALSMNPMKVFSAYGEAGAVVCDEEALYDRLTMLRYAGTVNREECREISLNHKPDTIQASMLLVVLRHLEDKVEQRRKIARYYDGELGSLVACPGEPQGARHVYYDYIIQCDRRDDLKCFLESRGIEVKIHHETLIPDQPAYENLPAQDLPAARRATERILSLPCHEAMRDDEAEYVAAAVRNFFVF
ncbi:MAG: DegT/DnrJ/EryC1/StrS family aminotransferase [Alphaproteobacteria bacterium]|jgi:dTDP-4-amino-4,6-dideoxygalactose transaminase|nr:DegT/DnrJ/EryC1/StrS family aminotransferase [Alphaproteobacteria bacterium]|tara:strand:- start:64 stop:1167 length:1104 start_codon:yes stop_codon:yes gene_type:complete